MIVKGYKGVMDLDLTNIPLVFHKSLIEQHEKDIEKYKLYQQTLEPELRYENAIELVLKKRAFYDTMRDEILKGTCVRGRSYGGFSPVSPLYGGFSPINPLIRDSPPLTQPFHDTFNPVRGVNSPVQK